MSIKTEIARLAEAKEAIMDALSAKGAALDGDERLNDLPSVISSIPSRAPDVTQAIPVITVSSGGLISASAEQAAGTVAAGTKSTTKQLTTQAAKTVTPTTSDQTAVASGRYTTGAVTVKGDANLKAENIAKGVSIFGVTGAHEGGGASGVGNCTVTISAGASVDNSVANILYTREEDGKLVTVQEFQSSKSVTVEIASGSLFVAVFNTMNGSSATNGTELMNLMFQGSSVVLFAKVTAAAGKSASLSMA